MPIPLDLLGKEIGTHRQFHPPITVYNKYRHSIHLRTHQQAYSIDYFTGLYTYWSKQYVSIENFTYLLVKQ